MSLLRRLFAPRQPAPPAHAITLINHTTPLDFRGIDRFSILEQPLTAITTIPWDREPKAESQIPFDPKRHTTMDGRVPDTIHRFERTPTPPSDKAIPLDFYILNGVLIQVVDNAAAYR